MWMVVRAFSVEVLCGNWKSMEIDHCKSIFWWPYNAIFCGSSVWFWSFLKNLCHISKLIFDCCYETHRFLWAIFVAISISSCFLRARLQPPFSSLSFLVLWNIHYVQKRVHLLESKMRRKLAKKSWEF